jgi:hypothetical protein
MLLLRTYEVAWLRQLALRHAIQQHGAGAE